MASQKPRCTQKHNQNPLNLVCLDQGCRASNLICTVCRYESHQNHQTIPIEIYLKANQIKINTSSKNLRFHNQLLEDCKSKVQDLLKGINGIQEKIAKLLTALKHEIEVQLYEKMKAIDLLNLQSSFKRHKSSSKSSSSSSSQSNKTSKNEKTKKLLERSRRKKDRQSNQQRKQTKQTNIVQALINKYRKPKSPTKPQPGSQKKTRKSKQQTIIVVSSSNELQGIKQEQQNKDNSQQLCRYQRYMKYNPQKYDQDQLKEQFLNSIGGKHIAKIIKHQRFINEENKSENKYLVYFAKKFEWTREKTMLPDFKDQIIEYWENINSQRNSHR